MSIPQLIDNRFVVGKQIARGAYSIVFQGTDRRTNLPIAIKFEPTDTDGAQLDAENEALKITNGTVGVPRVYYFGREGPYNVLVTDQLGSGLVQLFNKCGRKFSMKTVCMIAVQMIKQIQAVHKKGLIHRYLRPDNFILGMPESQEAQRIHIIAFGLAKRYLNPATGRHVPYSEGTAFYGSAPYMSINAHLGREQSRRDDLESIGYILIYFLRNTLPWMDLKGSNKLLYERIGERMQATSVPDLCAGLPEEFCEYLRYIHHLKFEQEPDYDFLCTLFKNLLKAIGEEDDGVYDWNRRDEQVSVAGPLKAGPSTDKPLGGNETGIVGARGDDSASPSSGGVSRRSSLSSSLLNMEAAPQPVVEPPVEIRAATRPPITRGSSYDSLLDLPATGLPKSNSRHGVMEHVRTSPRRLSSPGRPSVPELPLRVPPPVGVESNITKPAGIADPASQNLQKDGKSLSARVWKKLRPNRIRTGNREEAVVTVARTKERVVARQRRRQSIASNETTDDESYEEPVRGTGSIVVDDDDSETAVIDICCFCLCFRARH
ncbi:kinase-like protein [Leucogyrophana mollusca]|uniref:Kinase-like protein n=1 Tax=Leucogyrophana mollusca TaxID=85980 RepID=A0ACB8BRL8_9AGAM|nr:kinase-like protein [Leucogyrophana mollusca]